MPTLRLKTPENHIGVPSDAQRAPTSSLG